MPEEIVTGKVSVQEVLASLPPLYPHALLGSIRQRLLDSGYTLVVLDDDPTGTQTVSDIAVLTEWSEPVLEAELRQDAVLFFILTNSRSLPAAEVQHLNREIGERLVRVSRQTGKPLVVISRSDSTLRGHFPGELQALEAGLDIQPDGWLLIPFFLEGGRYTIHDVHYVAEGDYLVPAAETAFAGDATFGYQSSNLRQWVEEKTGSAIRAEAVGSISLEDLRTGGPDHVAQKLLTLADGAVCVVNAVALRDVEVLVMALLQVQDEKTFLFRSAASFVQVYAGMERKPLLDRSALLSDAPGTGGLIIVGSYVPKTTEQLQELVSQTKAVPLEVPAKRLLEENTYDEVIRQTAEKASQLLGTGQDVVMYTSRTLIKNGDAAQSLLIGNLVSGGLVAILQQITIRPRYLIAKGGITSSDLASKGLGVKRAIVLGQLLPGVPVWQLGEESRFPGLCYVVFPGNVGSRSALREAYEKLHR